MKISREYESVLCTLGLYLVVIAALLTECDARKSATMMMVEAAAEAIRTATTQRLDMYEGSGGGGAQSESSNTGPYGVNSPFSLPPYDSLPPINSPPFCVNPPFTGGGGPFPPYFSTPLPPTFPRQNPPPESIPILPSPTGPFLRPPPYYVEPSPPAGGYRPRPRVPIYRPPVVYPPPTVPPPPAKGVTTTLWCVAKPSVPEPIIQEAMNYACGSGADCGQILPTGSCFMPNTLFAHASYAFNSYWQRTKVTGGTCEFGGTAMLVTVDPSYDGCHFIYY